MLKDRFCPMPFTNFRVSASGDVSICSPERMKIPVVGNLLASSAEEVWNSAEAQTIRRGVLDGSYSQCIGAYCPALQKNSLPAKKGIQDPEMRRIIDNGMTTLDRSPQILNMHLDRTCNLKCPTCRTDVLGIRGAELDRATTVRDKIVDGGMLRNARQIILCGYGEVFASQVHLGFLRSLDPESCPQLKIHFLTNGLLLTERMWASFANAHRLVHEVAISVDAATPETFRLNRGGDFARLLNNLEFVSGLRRSKAIKRFRLNFVVQKNNFREMPAFVELGRRLGCDTVIFQKIVNAQNAFMTDYEDRAIHLPDHPERADFLEVLRHPALKERIVEMYSIGGVASEAEAAMTAPAETPHRSLFRSLFGLSRDNGGEIEKEARKLLLEHGALAAAKADETAKPKLRGNAPDPFWTKVAARIAAIEAEETRRARFRRR